MAKPLVFKRADIQHRKDNLEDGGTYIKPFVTVRNSESMAAGVNFLKNASVPWNLTCDELIFCQEGDFRLMCDGEAYTIGPGRHDAGAEGQPDPLRGGWRMLFFLRCLPRQLETVGRIDPCSGDRSGGYVVQKKTTRTTDERG